MGRLRKAIIVGLLTGLLGVALNLLPLGIDIEEDLGLHFLFKLRGVKQAPGDVVIVAVDKASSDDLRLPSDPRKWPRSLHAVLTERLAREGAAVIAFDIFFDEAKSIDEDAAFAGAVHNAGNVILSEYLDMERVSFPDKERGPSTDLTILKVIPPLPPLAQSAVALAPFPLSKVPVKVHQYWTFKTGAGDTPTLPVVALHIFCLDVYDEFVGLLRGADPRQASRVPPDREAILRGREVEKVTREIREIFETDPQLAEKMSWESGRLAMTVRDPRRGRLLQSLVNMYRSLDREHLNFYGPPGTILTIPYHEVLKGKEKADPARKEPRFKGKAVFVGQSERLRVGQKDGFYTVFSQANGLDLSGVEIAATAFSNLLADEPIRPLSPVTSSTLILLWGLAMGMTFFFFPTAAAFAMATGLSLFYLFFAKSQFNTTGTWYPVVIPLLLQSPLAFSVGLLWQYVTSNRERQNIRKAFGYYLPNSVVDQLSRNIADIKTSTQVVYGICLSTDAEHYTALSEAMDPAELGNFMNRYYEAIFGPIKQRAGIVANVLGDSVLAIWVASHADTPFRKEACLAALDIAEALRQFNRSTGPYTLPTRIGLHSGPLLLRHIGAMDHYEYRPIGDIVNTATRIEGLNKHLGTQILVSDEVVRQIDGFLTREIGTFLLAGKTKPLVVHGISCPRDEASEAEERACTLFVEALTAFRGQSWDEAIEKFDRARQCFGKDGPSSFYIKLCLELRTNPPGPSWNGVVQMREK